MTNQLTPAEIAQINEQAAKLFASMKRTDKVSAKYAKKA